MRRAPNPLIRCLSAGALALGVALYALPVAASDSPRRSARPGRSLPAEGAPGNRPRVCFPLVVQGLRPVGHPGLDRSDEIVTVGVPLPEAARIRDVSELAVSGAAVYQFRPLGAWESGNLKWVQVDFPASVAAGETREGFQVTRGSDPLQLPRLARPLGDRILVDTGPMQAVLGAGGSGVGILRKVVVRGTPILDGPGAFEIVAAGTDGQEYPAVTDVDSGLVLEQNGPVKAVVRAVGEHRSPAGEHLFDFTLRLTFFRGKTYVRGEYTLRNASREHPLHVLHRGITLRVRADLGEGRHYELPRHDEPWRVQGDLAPGEAAYLYLAHNSSMQVGDHAVRGSGNSQGWVPPLEYDPETGRYAEEGYRIVQGGVPIVPQTESWEYPRIVYGDLRDDAGRGIAAGIPYGPQYWPVSIAARGDGRLDVGLFSDLTGHDYTVNFFVHETRRFELEFHDRATVPYERAFQETYPLMARPADVRAINTAGVLPDRLVTLAEENGFFAREGVDLRIEPHNEPYPVVRYWNAGQGGGFNQYDVAYHDLVRYWRSGDAGAFLTARSWADYRSDWAVIHSDDFVFALNGDPRFPPVEPLNDGEFLVTVGHVFDNQHRHTRSLPLLYYFTGNERYRDAFLDDTEVVTLSDRVSLAYLNTRIQSKILLAGTLAHRFLQEIDPFLGFDENWQPPFRREEILENMGAYMRAILDARYDFSRACEGVQPKGWSDEPNRSDNDERRFWFAGGDRVRNQEPKFMLFNLFPDALWNYSFQTEPDDPNLPEIMLRILDLEHYFWNYLYSVCRVNPAQSSIGEFQYYLFDGDCRIPTPPECAQGDDFHPAYALETFAYLVTGDGLYLDHGVQFMKGQHAHGKLGGVNAQRTDFQNFVYYNTRIQPDDASPVIRKIREMPVDGETFAVHWTTDESAVGRIVYQAQGGERRTTGMELHPGLAHERIVGPLEPARVHRYAVVNRDTSGNWSMSVERAFAFDDFSRDTLGLYDVQVRGGGEVRYNPRREVLRFAGAPGSLAGLTQRFSISRERGRAALEFMPDHLYGRPGGLGIVLMENPGRYYELSVTAVGEGGGSVRLRKVVGGEVVARRKIPYDALPRGVIRVETVFRPRGLLVRAEGAGGEIRLDLPEGSPVRVNRIAFLVRRLSGWLDHLLLELG